MFAFGFTLLQYLDKLEKSRGAHDLNPVGEKSKLWRVEKGINFQPGCSLKHAEDKGCSTTSCTLNQNLWTLIIGTQFLFTVLQLIAIAALQDLNVCPGKIM